MKNMLNIGLVAVLFGLTACPTKEKIEPKCTNDRYLKDDGRTVNLGDTFWLSYKEKVILNKSLKISFSAVLSHTYCPEGVYCIVGPSLTPQISYYDSLNNFIKKSQNQYGFHKDTVLLKYNIQYEVNSIGYTGFDSFVKNLDTCNVSLKVTIKKI